MSEERQEQQALAAPRVTLIDRVVAAFSPGRGLVRMRARMAFDYIIPRTGGGYKAGRSNKGWSKRWHPGPKSAVTAHHGDMDTIRDRTRDLVRNSPSAAGASDLMNRSVIGRGLKVRPNPDHEFLGMTPEAAEEWARVARRVFETWSSSEGGCDIGRNVSFNEMQALVFGGVFDGGDVLTIERYLPNRGAPYGTCYHIVESEMVGNPQDGMDTRELAGGVRINVKTGEVLGYYVADEHPGETYMARDWTFVPAWNRRTGMRVARMIFRRRRLNERRGVPWLAPVMEELRQLEQYSEAELQAAVIAAMFTVFITSDHHSGSTLPDGSGSHFIGGDPDNLDSPEANALRKRREVLMGPGMVNRLSEGQKIEIANPDRPNTSFAPFVEMMWQHIGMGLGVPHEVWTMRYQSSFSAAKGALGEAWKTFRLHRSWMVEDFCQPAYVAVITEAAAKGEVDVPADFFINPLVRRAYCRSAWMGDAPAIIDPAKEVQAALLRIAGGLSTREREIREMFGDVVFDEIYPQLLKEAELMSLLPSTPLPAGMTDFSSDDDDDDGKSGNENKEANTE